MLGCEQLRSSGMKRLEKKITRPIAGKGSSKRNSVMELRPSLGKIEKMKERIEELEMAL
ncbi:hypothetical protein Goshw_008564 [Gossypium schwendimanii]|uniref:Uncharacterized protein n=1 Tax=Gossypium schwendimanii TaxID=34291 RepID=A0A7J9N9A8_GOSSC|nr:hypothetical protein [Gossypium schwendimanii]